MRAKLNHLKKIRVGAVSYLNTKPLLFGIKQEPFINQIELIEDYPAQIAQKLINDEIDVGLIPVAAILWLSESSIVTEYCIGSDGAVASVCIFSEVPIQEVEKVYLDYQSRTSIELARILLDEYWKQKVEFVDAKGEDFRTEIKGGTAGVIIGDRALRQRKNSKYIYDLGEAWKKHTGLPFVFAAWVANKALPAEFISLFNEANRAGLNQLMTVVEQNPFPGFDLKNYYENCISYELDGEKRKGLDLFLQKLAALRR